MSYVQVHSDLLKQLIDKIDDLNQNIEGLNAKVNRLQRRFGSSTISRKQFAEELGRSPRTVTRWIAEGKVHPVNSTGRPFFTMDELNRVKGKMKGTL